MDADLDTFVTALYVMIDDALRIHPHLLRWRPKVGLRPKLSDAELMTLAVCQALWGFTSETRFLRYAKAHLAHLFPYVPHQSGYNKRPRRAADQLAAVLRLLARDTELWEDDHRRGHDQGAPAPGGPDRGDLAQQPLRPRSVALVDRLRPRVTPWN